MTAVPAQVAGVRRIAVVTPNPVDATLVVARELGIDEVYAVGGAQAVAALAYGTETIEPVDAIVGPGNAYVTAAKLLVSSRVRIDLPAGPSEVVVIADAHGGPERVAADLLAQAEHGPDSEAILYTDDEVLAEAVTTLVAGHDNVRVELRRVARRGDRALGGVRARSTSSCTSRTPPCSLSRVRNAGLGVRRRLGGGRRLRGRARRTCCRRAGSRARPAGSGSRRS